MYVERPQSQSVALCPVLHNHKGTVVAQPTSIVDISRTRRACILIFIHIHGLTMHVDNIL